jgi:hypothetical protein
MADYLLITLEDEAAHAAQSPHEIAELIARRAQFDDELRRAGSLRDAGRLRPSREGKRVSAARVEAGPFEQKALSAFHWIEAGSFDEAAQHAVSYPSLPSDEIDVRPLFKGRLDATKQDKPGKVFACAVLGSAATEPAWSEVMDRIDAETSHRFPADSFVGGVRLEAPSRGRRVATRGERRAIFDGPFLESKEVIGGLCFVRMMSIDDALAWAAGSRFVPHGTLEIRELWRS